MLISTILFYILYALGILLAFITGIALFLLLVPIRYKLDGGYDNFIWGSFKVRSSLLLAVKGSWSSEPEKPLELKVVVLGIPFNLNPEKWNKEDNKPERKNKRKKRKEKGKSSPFSLIYLGMDRELIGSGKVLVRDLLRILRPDKVIIKGKLGFDEPHLNGWLAAFLSILEECCGVSCLDLQLAWDEEFYEADLSVEGRLALAVILYRLACFFLARKIKQVMAAIRKQDKASLA